MKYYVAIIAVAIFAALQLGHRREALGYYTAQIQECGKITNSSNVADFAKLGYPPLSWEDRREMEQKCMDRAKKRLERSRVWFFDAQDYDYGDQYEHERYHY